MLPIKYHNNSTSFFNTLANTSFSTNGKKLTAFPSSTDSETFFKELLLWGENNGQWKDLKIGNTIVPRENALKWAKLNLELKIDPKDFELLVTTFTISHVDDLLKSTAITFLKVVCLKLPHLVEKYLTEMNADPNAAHTFEKKDHKTTVSALRFALHWKDAKTFEVLLKHGAKLTSSFAEEILKKSYEIEKYRDFAPVIIKYRGHKLDDSYFVNPSAMIAQFKHVYFFHATLFNKDDLAFLDFLLKQGADINDLCKDESLLFLAAENEDLETIQWLFKKGAKIDIGKNLLLACQKHEKLEVAQWFLKNGVKVNTPYLPNEEHPLVCAYQNKNMQIVELLIDAGAKMPIAYIVKLLNGTSLLSSDQSVRIQRVIDLIAMGAVDPTEVDDTSKLKSPLLHYAIDTQNIALVEALLKAGAKPNCQDKYGVAPLHLSVLYKDYNMTKLLLDHGANINLQTTSGYTPLHLLANLRFDKKIGDLLLDWGADLNIRDSNDHIPFNHLLSYRSKLPFAKKIAEKGVHPLGTSGESYKDQLTLYASYKKTHHPLSKKYLPFPLADLTKHVWQEHYLRKILGHIYDVGGHSPLSFRKSPSKTLNIISLEGVECSNILSRKGVKATRLLFKRAPKLLPRISFDTLLNVHRFNANFSNSPKDYAKRIASGKPTVIHGGFRTHAVSYFFYKDAQNQNWFVLCNTGAESQSGPLESFLYNPNKLKESHIVQIFQLKLESPSEYRVFVRAFMKDIECKEIPLTQAFEKEVPFEMQTKGHCVWTSFEVVNWAVVMLPPVANKQVDEVKRETSKWIDGFEKWRRLLGASLLSKYLELHLSNTNPYVPDIFLLNTIKQNKKTQPPKELISSIEILETAFPSPTAKEREECINHFKAQRMQKRPEHVSYKKIRKTYLGD